MFSVGIGQRDGYVASSPQWLDASYLHFPASTTKSPFNLLFTTTRFRLLIGFLYGCLWKASPFLMHFMMYDGGCSVNITLTAYSKVRHGGYWALCDLTLCMGMVGMSSIEFVLSVCQVRRFWEAVIDSLLRSHTLTTSAILATGSHLVT
jgi:hypothetical protein